MVVGGEGSFVAGVDLPVVPDGGGEGEQALADACPDAFGDVCAVVFEGELAFEGVVDRLDPLAYGAELAEPCGFVFAVGADELRVKGGDCLLYTSPSPRDGLLSRMPSSA